MKNQENRHATMSARSQRIEQQSQPGEQSTNGDVVTILTLNPDLYRHLPDIQLPSDGILETNDSMNTEVVVYTGQKQSPKYLFSHVEHDLLLTESVEEVDREPTVEELLEEPEYLSSDLVADLPLDDPLRQYLTEILRYPLLTAQEEVRLLQTRDKGIAARKQLAELSKEDSIDTHAYAIAIRQGDQARQRLINSNLRLVVSVAKKYQGRGISLLDLIQDGNIGLMKGLDKFKVEKGFRISTYVTWWIKQSINREIANKATAIRRPVHLIESIRAMNTVIAQLQHELGHEPSDEEIAIACKTKITVIQTIKNAGAMAVPASLDAPINSSDGDDMNLGDNLADSSPSVSEQAVSEALREDLANILNDNTIFTPRERRILELRFGFIGSREQTLEEVGREFGVTRERIRQLEAKALRKFRHPKYRKKLRGYLS